MTSKKRPYEKRITHRYATDDPEAIPRLAAYLLHGHLVAFPTDTVYGVGVDAMNPDAIRRLFQVKQRPFTKGIPILVADQEDLDRVAGRLPDLARTYIDRFWPGPLTLIVPRHPQLPAILAPNNTIAVRMPDSHVARCLIRAAGGILAVSSANLSGQPPAQDGRQALAALDGRITAVLDGGPTPQAVASTVVDCTGASPQILRAGPITAADLRLEMQETL